MLQDPNTICKSLGACVTDQIQPERLLNKPLPKKDVKSSTTECVLCEFVMKQVDEMLGNNATQVDDLPTYLFNFCCTLPLHISSSPVNSNDLCELNICGTMSKDLS